MSGVPNASTTDGYNMSAPHPTGHTNTGYGGYGANPFTNDGKAAVTQNEYAGHTASTGGQYDEPTYKASSNYAPQPTYNQQQYTPQSSQPFYPTHQDAGTQAYEQDDPSNKDLLDLGVTPKLVDWNAMKAKNFWFRKKMYIFYVVAVVIIVVVALMTFYHKQIVNWLTPAGTWLRDRSWGWIIAVLIIIALSTPPLFGNEIVLVLVGLVWGLWKGFGIAIMGTVLGEVLNFFLFKYACRGRAEKQTHKSFRYACLARVLRDGGFLMCFVSRLSLLPTHFTTIVFAVCGLNFFLFFAALLVSSPKQLVNVYVGVILAKNNAGTSSTNSRVISDSIFAVTAVVTVAACFWIWKRMEKVREEVWDEHKAWLANKGPERTWTAGEGRT